MTAAARAASITFTLALDDDNGVYHPGQWTVYAETFGTSQGIAAFQVNLTGVNVITAAANVSPKCNYDDSTGTLPIIPGGFSAVHSVLSQGPSPQGGNSYEIDAAQNTFDYIQDHASAVLIPAMGQAAGTFTQYLPYGYDTVRSAIQPTWARHLRLATGTYNPQSGIFPAFNSDVLNYPTKGNVFTDIQTGGTTTATIGEVTFTNEPEPASVAMAGVVASVSLLTRRRRT